MSLYLVREGSDPTSGPSLPPAGALCAKCGRRLQSFAVVDGKHVCARCSGSLDPLGPPSGLDDLVREQLFAPDPR